MKKAILKGIGMFMIIGALISSCAGEQGEPGPVGEQGQQGDKGDAGNDGSDGENGKDGKNGIDGVAKSGFFEGTISGKRTDGVEFTYDFKFDRRRYEVEYLGTDTEGFAYVDYCDCHQLILVRQDSAFGGNLPSELRLILQLKNKGTANEKLEFGTDFGQIFFLKELSATSIFRVAAIGYDPYLEDAKEITNYHYDSNTGHMTFEFDITVGPAKGYDPRFNSTKHDLNIKGKFDSGEGKVYKDVVARKGN